MKIFFLIFAFSTASLLAENCEDPWFTGPLLAPGGHVVPSGYINVEPYTFYTVTTGLYDKDWKSTSLPNRTNVNFQFLLYLGITKWMDVLFIPQAVWNETQRISSLRFGDLSIELDFQVFDNSITPAIPSLKAYVNESFPTGSFQKSNPGKASTDLSGSGSFETTFGFVLTSLYQFWDCHFLNLRLNAFITLLTKVPVKGINAYGGTPTTEGTIYPGLKWGGIFALQYNLTKHWAFALDIEGLYSKKTSFRGFSGSPPNHLGNPSNISFSIAPAIEYNFNEALGIIAGSWFTVAGKNAPQFFSGVVAINYYGPFNKSARASPRPPGRTGGSGR